MSDFSPWDEISVPGTDFNVRQVAGKTAVPCFWGRDSVGACLFIVELQGNHATQYRKNVVTVSGIDIDLREGAPGQQRLVLALERQVDRDLFEGLCRTLAASLEHATDSVSSLAVTLAHVRRWKTFLAGNSQHLSGEEIRGLFAELIFLRELISKPVPSVAAVEAWLGPERSHQDFIFGNTAVEIKSLNGTERSTTRISSEDQLESLNDKLYLRIYRLSNLADAPGACSLNEVISEVQNALANSDVIEAFDRKLVIHGYVPLPVYDQPRFVVSEVRSYRIEDGFPHLIRSRLPPGIANVTYDIKLETIESFECDGEKVFEDY